MDNKDTLPYTSFAPVDKVENYNVYAEALEWALSKDDVNNIALTGVYGSGKSSIIKTFFNKHKNYKHIDISLASFNSDIDNEQSIEQGILQQLFYSIPPEYIPLSRFKRKKAPLKIKIFAYVVIIMFLLIIRW